MICHCLADQFFPESGKNWSAHHWPWIMIFCWASSSYFPCQHLIPFAETSKISTRLKQWPRLISNALHSEWKSNPFQNKKSNLHPISGGNSSKSIPFDATNISVAKSTKIIELVDLGLAVLDCPNVTTRCTLHKPCHALLHAIRERQLCDRLIQLYKTVNICFFSAGKMNH